MLEVKNYIKPISQLIYLIYIYMRKKNKLLYYKYLTLSLILHINLNKKY